MKWTPGRRTKKHILGKGGEQGIWTQTKRETEKRKKETKKNWDWKGKGSAGVEEGGKGE